MNNIYECVCVYVYIYIYIQRDREKRDRTGRLRCASCPRSKGELLGLILRFKVV